jgi:hypothetical protein
MEGEERKGKEQEHAVEETNIGMKLLLKLGWSAGKGLGKDLQGEYCSLWPGGLPR